MRPIEPGAAQALVDAVGHDLRALAAAVRQLLADSEDGPVTATRSGATSAAGRR